VGRLIREAAHFLVCLICSLADVPISNRRLMTARPLDVFAAGLIESKLDPGQGEFRTRIYFDIAY
jgi:hypothetical protein